jgi:hypothetical protein
MSFVPQALLTPLKRLLFAMLLVCCVSSAAFSQTITGDIGGTVTDSSGAVVVGATVTAQNVATNVTTSTTTNKQGIYSIRFLQIGTYKLKVVSSGFATTVTPPFLLEVSQVAKIDATLKAGAETTVQVNGTLAPILNTENGTISTSISASLINDLPVNGHNFTELAQFVPGVSIGDQNQFNGATGSPNNSGERTQSFATLPNINGNRTYNNNYYVDGIENTDPGANLANGFGASIYSPNPDALANETIITTVPPAEYGNANGGHILTVLKSGTNDYHGSASVELQNWEMDANTFGNKRVLPGGTFTPRGKYTQTIFGGTFGGPVRIPHLFNGRDKLFIFGDYLGYRKPSGGVSTTSVVPNAWRGNTTPGSFDTTVSPLAGYAYFGSSVPQLYDSQNGFAPLNQTIGGVTYKNLVPIRNSVAKYLFQHPELYPLSNVTGVGGAGLIQNNYSGPVKSLQRNDQFDVKMDWNITEKDRLSARFSYSDANDKQTRPLTPVSFPGSNFFPYKGVSVNYVRTITPAIVNEFRVGLTRTHYNAVPNSGNTWGTNGDAVVGIAFANQTVPGFTAQSFSGAGAQGTSAFGTAGATNTAVDNLFSYIDDLTIQHGRHIFKLGGNLNRYQTNFFAGANYGGALGTMGYSGAFTGNPGAGQTQGYDFADFLLGYVSTLSVATSTGDFGSRSYRGAVFAQDDFKVTPTLTVNYGLRWQYTQPVYEVNNKISNLNLTTGQLIQAGVNGNSRSLYNAVHNEFNPRAGFAWQVRPRLVVRGGFAITTFMDYNALAHFGNAPFVSKVGLTANVPTATSAGSPYATSAGFPSASGSNSNYTAWTNLKPQFVPQFSFVTEYQISNTASITAQYVGETGSRLLDVRNPNQWAIVGQASSAPYYSSIGSGSVNLLESEGNFNFNAGEITYRQRPAHGLEITANYTYSKNLADTNGPIIINDITGAQALPQDSNNLRGEYGPVGSDIRHMLNGTFVYTLPFGRGQRFGSGANFFVNELIGGWRVAGDAALLGGFPVLIRAGSTSGLLGGSSIIRARQYRKMKIVGRKYGYIVGQTGTSGTTGTVGYNQYPNNEIVAGAFGSDPSATHSNYIGAGTCNNSALAQDDQVCAYGIPYILTTAALGKAPNFSDTVHPGTERAPAFRGADAAVMKDFAIHGEHKLEFQAKAYNVGNITSYNNPNNIINGSNNWGIVQSTRSQQRQLELALKYKF